MLTPLLHVKNVQIPKLDQISSPTDNSSSMDMFQGFGFFCRLDRGAAATSSQRPRHTLWVGGGAKSPTYEKSLTLKWVGGGTKSLTYEKSVTLKCERGDSNPQGILLPLPPQGSVSTSSTTSARSNHTTSKEKKWQNGF